MELKILLQDNEGTVIDSWSGNFQTHEEGQAWLNEVRTLLGVLIDDAVDEADREEEE